jgi:hypothetical protein
MEKDANKTPGRVRHFVAITGAVLNMSEELGVVPCPHFIHEYTRILCRAGELDTACQVVLHSLEQTDGKVFGRTMNMVAIENAKAGKYDVARNVLSKSNEPTPVVLKRIEYMEKGMGDPVRTTRYGVLADYAENTVPDETNGDASSEGGLPQWRIRTDPTKSGIDSTSSF